MYRSIRSSILFLPLVAAACAVTPDSTNPSSEATGSVSSAVEPDAVMGTTTYTVSVSAIEVGSVTSPYTTTGTQAAYAEGVGLAATVNGSLLNPPFNCSYGTPTNGTTLYGCGPGSSLAGSPLASDFVVTQATDVVNIGLTLDNIDGVTTAVVDNSLSSTMNTLGTVFQATGTIVALIPPASAVGGIIAGIGKALSIASTFFSKPNTTINCGGGLVANPTAGNTTPQDTLYFQYTGEALKELTASGPYVDTVSVGTNWNNQQCITSQYVQVTIKRKWTDGLAAYAKSADSASVRTEQSGSAGATLDSFSYNQISGIQHTWGAPSSGWRSELATASFQENIVGMSGSPPTLSGDTSIATVTRGQYDENVFFVDTKGRLYWSHMINGGWGTSEIAYNLPPGASVTAVSRTPALLDVFWTGTNGAVYWWAWNDAVNYNLAPTTTMITAAGVAAPGGGLAAVARTPTNLDVFFVGTDAAGSGAWTASWAGGAWNSYEIAYTANQAPKGAPITAVAHSVNNLDAYYVGSDGGLYTIYWAVNNPPFLNAPVSNGQPSFATMEIAGTKGTSAAGASVSAVSRLPTDIDVAYTGAGTVKRSSWDATTGWTSGPIAAASGAGYVANGSPISIVAPWSYELEVFFSDAFFGRHTAYWNQPAPGFTLSSALPLAEWQGWDNVSGGLVTDPSIAAPDATHLMTFATAPNGTIWYSVFNGTTWNGWLNLGNGGHTITDPPVAVAVNGKVEVFVRDSVTGNLLHQEATCASASSCPSPSWNGGGWENLGGTLIAGAPTVVVSQPSNQINVFATWTDGTARTIAGEGYGVMGPYVYHVGTVTKDLEGEWTNLSGSVLYEPGAVSWGADRLDVFVVGGNSEIFHRYSDDNGVTWLPANGNWEPVGGSAAATPAVTSWGPNRLDVVTNGSSGALSHLAWTGTSWGTCSSPPCWDSLGGTGYSASGVAARPVAITRGTNELDVFVQGTDRHLYTTTLTSGSSAPVTWAPWVDLLSTYVATSCFHTGGAPSVVSKDGTSLDMAITGTASNGDANVFHNSITGTYPVGEMLPLCY